MQLNKDRRPVDKMDHVDQLVSEGSKSSPVRIFHLQLNQIHESKLVETADFDNESCEVEGAKAHNYDSKERSSNISSGRITRSRDSVRQPCSMSESSHAGTLAYAGKSSKTDDNVGSLESSEQQIEENYASFGRGFCSGTVGSLPELKQTKVGGKQFDAVSPAPSFRVKPHLCVYYHFIYEDNLGSLWYCGVGIVVLWLKSHNCCKMKAEIV